MWEITSIYLKWLKYVGNSFSMYRRTPLPEGIGERVTACRKGDGDEIHCGSVS